MSIYCKPLLLIIIEKTGFKVLMVDTPENSEIQARYQ